MKVRVDLIEILKRYRLENWMGFDSGHYIGRLIQELEVEEEMENPDRPCGDS